MELSGTTFRDAIFRYDTSTLLGVVAADGELLLPPPLDRRFEPGDQVIAISEDGVSVLTALVAGAAGLAPFGVIPISLD